MKELIEEYKRLKKEGFKEIKDDMEIINLKKKSKIKKLENEIGESAIDMIKNIVEISNKYEVEHEYTDVVIDRGSWSFYIKNDKVNVRYQDSWAYGGYCDEWYNVTFKELIEFDKDDFVEKTKSRKINELEKQIEYKTSDIEKMKSKIKELQNEIQSKI